ncbi:unnamed protein product [Rotaria socialis]|uniref:Secreted protein n=1 Tax=Rotaria socialis TaxID=392032 RepID=A0A817VRD9_9BILA|nr:unnamed protein product [Rotaria socialis]
MISLQFMFIQLLLRIVSKQAVMQPFDGVDNDHNEKVVQFCSCFFLTENMEENFLKLTKRRPHSKANLVELWGVRTRFS